VIDCHAHLDEFDDVASILENASSAGIEAVIGVGINCRTSLRILELSRLDNAVSVYPAIGLYPDEVNEVELERMLALIDREYRNIVALGEIGLDYWIRALRKKQPHRDEVKALQQKAFNLQLEKAAAYQLPVIVHSRGAWADALLRVRESGVKRALFHWYSGPLDILDGIIREGFLVSATPATAYSPHLREVLQAAPLDRIVLETDCPVPRRVGEEFISTSPADIIYSLEALSKLKGVDPGELSSITTTNARNFFFSDSI